MTPSERMAALLNEETLSRPEVEEACALAVARALDAFGDNDAALRGYANSALIGLIVSRPSGGVEGIESMMRHGVEQPIKHVFSEALKRNPTWGEQLAIEAWAIAKAMKAMEPKP